VRNQSTLLGNFELFHDTHSDSVHRVVRGRSLSSGEEVEAILLTAESARDPRRRAAFQKLQDTASALSHANVVPILSSGSSDVPYFIQRLPRGIPLDRLLATRKLEVEVACDIALQMAAALAAGLERGVVHGCLVPRSVYVELDAAGSPRVQVTHFGLLHALLGETTYLSLSRHETQFTAPELLESGSSSPRGDIYSAGMLLHEMLSRASYRGGDGTFARPNQDLGDLIRRNPAVPEPLVRSVASAIATNPSARLRSAQDLARLLIPYVKPRAQEALPRVQSLDPVLRAAQESDVPPSVLLNRAPRPRTDSACPEAMLVDPTFPRSPTAPKLEALHADAYGRRRPPANMELETVEHAKFEPEAALPPEETINRTAAVALGAGFGVGAAVAWLGKLL
jgi:eukaryotic-like serine/threonine-protein kinase